MSTRVECDGLGEREIPGEAYWGVHTARAVDNFPISGTTLAAHPELIRALGAVKQAAVRANRELGVLDPERAGAIDTACQDVRDNRLDDQFVVDVIQGGAGTSTNMNANEVIANRALRVLGLPLGSYHHIHPIDHVNRGQSTNDTYPTAVKLALIEQLTALRAALERVRAACEAKGGEFAGIPKVGRTQLQDAVPMTVGQEFRAWAATLAEEDARLAEAARLLTEINLGATAIGTGITSAPGYARTALRHLRELTGLELATAPDLIEATSDTGAFVHASGAIKRAAVKVSKICNDLRLLSSGPQAGLGELVLPARQAGSSIMPGKVNPVIPEVVNQVAFAIIGTDVTITMAAEAGQLQLNAFEPLIAHCLLRDLRWLTRALTTLTEGCLRGITVRTGRVTEMSATNAGLATALTPLIGYRAAAQLAAAALHGNRPIHDLATETGLADPTAIAELLRPENLITVPGSGQR